MNISGIKFIGYDLLQKNVKALKSGKVNYLLAQRPEIQSYRGMKALCEYKIFKNEIKRKNFMPDRYSDKWKISTSTLIFNQYKLININLIILSYETAQQNQRPSEQVS